MLFRSSLLFLFEHDRDMARSLQDTERTALRAGHHALQRGARGDEALGDVQVVLIHIVVVFRIGGGRFHQFVKELRGANASF